MRFFLISSCAVLALSGCKGLYDPHFMPTGYAYHQNDFKGQPGAKDKDQGYKYNLVTLHQALHRAIQ